MEILNKIKQLILRLKRKEVTDMNVDEVLVALEDIEADLKGFSLVTAVTNVIAKVEALKAKVTPVVENAEVASQEVAQDAEAVASDVQDAGEEVAQPEAPVEPAVPTEPTEPVDPAAN